MLPEHQTRLKQSAIHKEKTKSNLIWGGVPADRHAEVDMVVGPKER